MSKVCPSLSFPSPTPNLAVSLPRPCRAGGIKEVVRDTKVQCFPVPIDDISDKFFHILIKTEQVSVGTREVFQDAREEF